MIIPRIVRSMVPKRNFMKSAVRKDDHDLGGEPGKVSKDDCNIFYFIL